MTLLLVVIASLTILSGNKKNLISIERIIRMSTQNKNRQYLLK